MSGNPVADGSAAIASRPRHECPDGHQTESDEFCDVCGLTMTQPGVVSRPSSWADEVSLDSFAGLDLDDPPPAVNGPHPARPVPVVSAVAGRTAGLTVRLLPPADRGRYAEEFASELHDLAGQGAGRWRQLAYALRLACRTGQLRLELRAGSSQETVP